MNLGYRTAQRAFGAVGTAALCVAMGTACSGTIEAQTTESNRTPRTAAPAATPSTNTATGSTTAPPPRPPQMMVMEPEETDPPADPPEETETAGISFETDVWPIFNDKCGPSCHVDSGFGNQNIGSDDLDEAFEDSVAFETSILNDLNSGSMPIGCDGGPGSPGCVTVADFETIEAWYEQGAPR